MKDISTLLPDIRLDFNINHPNLEECYLDGYVSAQSELSENENPFHRNSVEARHWIEGWWAGFYGEEPLYDLTKLVAEEPLVITAGAVNDDHFFSPKVNLFLLRCLELSGALAVSAIIGYQLIELVA
jgi:hypothetical protein